MSTGFVGNCASTLAQASRRLARAYRRHPVLVGIVVVGVAGGLLPGPAGLAGHIWVGVIAALWSAVLVGAAVCLMPSRRAWRAIAVQLHPAPPHDMAAALRLAEVLLAGIQPGPETVRAADPAVTEVRWDTGLALDGQDLDPARAHKMKVIRRRFIQEAVAVDVLHQMPQILLIAADGAVIKLLGSTWPDGTGVISLIPAETIPAPAQ